MADRPAVQETGRCQHGRCKHSYDNTCACGKRVCWRHSHGRSGDALKCEECHRKEKSGNG